MRTKTNSGFYSHSMERNRSNEIKIDLYRAISNGDIAKADEIMKLMYMVDIDRELIWEARSVKT